MQNGDPAILSSLYHRCTNVGDRVEERVFIVCRKKEREGKKYIYTIPTSIPYHTIPIF